MLSFARGCERRHRHPTADNLCRDVLRRVGREGCHQGHWQVAGEDLEAEIEG